MLRATMLETGLVHEQQKLFAPPILVLVKRLTEFLPAALGTTPSPAAGSSRGPAEQPLQP
jgi:hypothetical protein